MREREKVLQEFGVATHTPLPLPLVSMADEIVRLREALAAAPRVRVLDEWRVVDKHGNITHTHGKFGTFQEAVIDNLYPYNAPHRVVRVALVDDDTPAAAGREVTVDDEMVERAAEAMSAVDDYVTCADDYREHARAALTAALAAERGREG